MSPSTSSISRAPTESVADRFVAHEQLRHWAGTQGARPFVRCGGEWLSYASVDARADRLAAGLTGLGLLPGDRIATLMPNREEYFAILFGCARAGLILVPLNAYLKGEFLAHQLRDSGARALIADRDGWAAAAPLLGSTGIEFRIAVDPAQSRETTFADLARCAAAPPQVAVAPSDIAAILYTSGTTGLPKGCMLSHAYLTAIARGYDAAGWLGRELCVYTAFPLFHTSGLAVAVMCALRHGARVAFATAFRASSFIDEAVENEATTLWGVGAMALAVLAQPEKPQHRGLSFPYVWFAPLTPEQQAAFNARFHTEVIAETYGQTECVPATLGYVGAPRRPSTAGPQTANLEVRIVDEHDNEVPTGTVGEIVVRPRVPGAIFSGYWQNPAATVAALRNLWHHTGDSGLADEHGHITFVDRKRDSLRRRGENVSSMELEQAIARHPKVAQCAVHAVTSAMTDDDIKACIVPAPGDPPTPEELFAFFRQVLPYYAIPRYVQLRDSLPVNAMNRVMKHVLRAEPLSDKTWDLELLGLVVPRAERRGA
jgi:carnitine-CoA ligase